MANLAKMIGGQPEPVRLRQATVTAAPSGGAAPVQFGAGATAIAGVRHLASANIANGDVVWVLQNGYDLLIVGKVGAYQIGGTDQTVTEPLQFPSTITDNKINLWSTSYSIGVRSHTLVFRTGGSNADLQFVFEQSGGNRIASMYYGPYGGLAHIGNAYVGAHPVHGASWAGFGHWDRQATTEYAFMQASSGDVLVNSGGTTARVRVLIAGTTKVTIDSGWVTTETPLTAKGGAIGGEGIIGTWSTNHASFGRYGTVNLSGGNPFGYMMRNDGRCWIGASSTAGNGVVFRLNGNDKYIFSDSGGVADVRFVHLYAVTGNVPVEVSGASGQLFKTSSSKRFKKNIRDLPVPVKLADNPVMKLRPRRFHWRDDDPGAPPEAHLLNQRHPDGIPGFIAEEIAEVAPDCVVWEEQPPVLPSGGEGPGSLLQPGDSSQREADWPGPRPLVVSQLPLLAHLVQAIHILDARLAKLEQRPVAGP